MPLDILLSTLNLSFFNYKLGIIIIVLPILVIGGNYKRCMREYYIYPEGLHKNKGLLVKQ